MFVLMESCLSALPVISCKAILLAILAVVFLASLRIRDRNVHHRVWTAVLFAMLALPVLGRVRHEQAHIDRKDLLVNLLAEINRCFYWFHPLAWFVRTRLAALAEHSCDDSVISVTGDRSKYAGHLLDIACRMSLTNTRVAPFGASMARTSQVESRIDAIPDASRPLSRRLGRNRRAVLAAVVLPLVLLSACANSVEEDNQSGDQAASTKPELKEDAPGDDDTAASRLREGRWIKYQVESRLDDTITRSFLTVAILDKKTRQGQLCRWIEVIRENDDINTTLVTRMLVPEVHLRPGVNALEKALVVLQRFGDQPPVDYTDTDRSEIQPALSLVMSVRQEGSRQHDSEPIEIRGTTMSIPGWSNHRVESDRNDQGLRREITNRWWVTESATMFGVLRTEESIKQIDTGESNIRKTSAVVVDGGRGARSRFTGEVEVPEPFALTPGWEWALSPQGCNYASMSTSGMVIRIDKEESIKVTLAFPAQSPDGVRYIKYRPVAFDAGRKRYEFKHNGINSSGDVGLGVFNLKGNVPIDRIADIGIERLTTEGLKVVAEIMAQPARDAGVEPLPFPIVDQPYTFSITSTENETLRSEDLLGKVVLIDCWATWCTPCMAKMPKLKSMYDKWHSDGFEIIGVSSDRSIDIMQETVDSMGLSWPQVMVPTDPAKSELWEQASGVTSLPRLLLIDRNGILHADCSPLDLESLVEQLMRENRTNVPVKPPNE